MSPALALVPPDDDGMAPHPGDTAREQIVDVLSALKRSPQQFLHFTWPALDELVGGISRGEVWFFGGFSGDGKTTFAMSAVDAWHRLGRRIYYMGLESKPWILRTHWACRRLGLDAGDVLSGKAAQTWPDWSSQRERLSGEVLSQDHGDNSEHMYFSGVPFVNLRRLREACEQAADLRSDVMIVDHIDHIEPEAKGKSAFDESRAVIKALMGYAQEYDLRLLVATQFNNDAIKGNRLGRYQAPQPQAVYMGSHKRQVASGMLGLYRPLKFGSVDVEALKRFRSGDGEPQDVCEPNTMGVCVMKHRLYGNREGKRAFLGVRKGAVVELDSVTAEMARHGISSGGGR